MADGNDHRLFGNEIFQIDLADFFAADFGLAFVAVFAFQFQAVAADDGADVFLVRQNVLMLANFREQLVMLAGQLFLFQIDELAQRHFQNGVGLHGG